MVTILRAIIVLLLAVATAHSADYVGSTWGFFGDSQTSGRAPAGSLLTSSPEAIDTISSLTSTEYISGLGGCSLTDSVTRYSAYGSKSALTWVHFQESGNQDLDGQTTASAFASTFISSMTTIHSGSPSAVITYETAYSFKREAEQYRDWSTYNATLGASVATLASSGITVKIADVNASITWASAQLGDAVVWYQDGDANEFHYTEVGNLMVAMTVWDALGYDVATLDFSAITDVSAGNISTLKSYFKPEISSVSGTVSEGQTLIINGTGFRTKPAANPNAYDNFNDGSITTTATIGTWDSINDLTSVQDGTRGPIARSNFNDRIGFGGVNCNSSPLSRFWYMSFWIKFDANWEWGVGQYDSGDSFLSNIKFPYRLWNPSGSADENFYTSLGWSITSNAYTNIEHMGLQGSPSYNLGTMSKSMLSDGTWHKIEAQVGDSSVPYAPDANMKIYFDGTLVHDLTFIGQELWGFKRPQFVGLYNAWSQGGNGHDNTVYFDDFYVDTTFSRVELCPGSEWSNKGKCEIQVPTSWSSTVTEVTVNKGSLTTGATAYLYVVDSNGGVNTSGYEVTVGESLPLFINFSGSTTGTVQ